MDRPSREGAALESADAASPAKDTAWVVSTHVAQGLPYSLVHKVIASEYFVTVGMDPTALGLTSLLHLPWLGKFLWAPRVVGVGTAKRWMIALQMVLAALTGGAALLAALGTIPWMVVLLVAMAFVAATNDIAIDTYYLRALDKPRQAKYSGLRIGAYRAALFLGNGALVTYAGFAGFDAALVVCAGVLVVAALVHALILDPAEPREGAASRWRLDVVKSFFEMPGIWLALAFIMTFRAGDSAMFAMRSLFLKELGLDLAARGFYSGVLGTGASIAGSMIGAAIISRRSLERTLVPIAVVQGTAILLYAALAALRPSLPFIVAIVLVEEIVAGVGTAAFVVFILRLCDGQHKATHFAFATALMSVAMTVAGAASGFLYKALGAGPFFVLAFVAALPGMALSPFVRRIKA